MIELVERNIRLKLPVGLKAEKFDGIDHGLSFCMKAVDFVVETSSHIVFIEFKDPDNPNIPEDKKELIMREYKSGGIDDDLVRKFRDTWLYKRSENKINKPVNYIVLIACASLSTAELGQRQAELRKKLPIVGKADQNWKWFIDNCFVLNIEGWKKWFPTWSIDRLDAA